MNQCTYIVDFDDCLFDTARLKDVLAMYGIDTALRSDRSIEQIQARGSVPESDLRSFLFPDARAWLEAHGAECHIVTSFVGHTEAGTDETSLRAFQEAKIAAAAIYEYVAPERVHIVGRDKTATLASLQHQYRDTPVLYIDNHPAHLEAGQLVGVTPVQLIRDTHRTDDTEKRTQIVSWPIIFSFAELGTLTDWLFASGVRGEELS